jgi:hypothetical protein
MNHAELSRDLALALGYEPARVRLGRDACYVITRKFDATLGIEVLGSWPLDYRDPTVWGPVLIWLMREHRVWPQIPTQTWDMLNVTMTRTLGIGDTLPEAIARAAIAVVK